MPVGRGHVNIALRAQVLWGLFTEKVNISPHSVDGLGWHQVSLTQLILVDGARGIFVALVELLLSLVVVERSRDRRGQVVSAGVFRVFTARPLSFVIIELGLAELVDTRVMALSINLIHRVLAHIIGASVFGGQRPFLLHLSHAVVGVVELWAINLQSFLLVAVELLGLNSYILWLVVWKHVLLALR